MMLKTAAAISASPPCNSGLPPVAEYRLEDFRTPDFPINGITSTPVKTLSTSRNNAGEIIAGSSAGCDTGCYEAWQKCTGDPSVIVAVLDDGVMYTHPDLADNIWVNEGEELRAGTDADGNGYKDDKYGYNFVTNTANISWTDVEDIGHGTHVSGTIAAMNNGEGVCGIAGGDGTKNSGVKIMICQVFSGNNSVSLNGEAKAIKYAADNGAVILQCSWGYNSAEANEVEGYTPGPATEKEWADTYPLEKEILDYFINNAGSPNGVIDGGIAVFASGNEYAGPPVFRELTPNASP